MKKIIEMKKDLTAAAEIFMWNDTRDLAPISSKIKQIVMIHNEAIKSDEIEFYAIEKIEEAIIDTHQKIYGDSEMRDLIKHLKEKKQKSLLEFFEDTEDTEEQKQIIKELQAMTEEAKNWSLQ